jgi:hypothetical protein
MKIELHSNLTEKVLALTQEHGYAPDEVISIGIALATVLLEERRLGNQIVVVDSNGNHLAEFKEVEPKAIHEVVQRYEESLWPEMAEGSAALLVARLERERDAERRNSKHS